MRIITDLVDLQVATLAIREIPFPENRLEQYLPVVENETVDYRLARTDRFNQAANIRAFDMPAPIIGRPDATVVKGGLPAISAMDVITETDAIRARRMARLDNGDAVANNVNGILARTTQAVQNKYELLRGMALSQGVIVVNENGVQQAVDFDVPSENKVTRAKSWLDPTANILAELMAWQQVRIDSAGSPAAVALTSSRVLQAMLLNEGIRGLFNPRPSIISPESLNQQLAAFGLPRIETYDRKIDTGAKDARDRPVRQRVIAEDRFVLLGDDPIGETQTGLTEDATLLAEQGVLAEEVAPGMVAVTLVNDHPVFRAGLTASIGLPVIERPDEIVTATVLS